MIILTYGWKDTNNFVRLPLIPRIKLLVKIFYSHILALSAGQFISR